MFCYNCGNKLESNTIICDNCGTVVGRGNYKKNIKKKELNIKSVICLILAIISILMCFNFMLRDISKIGMYTQISEKLYYAINLVLVPLLVSFITLIISYSSKDNDTAINKLSLFLSIISLIMVALEIVIVIIY